MNSFHALSHEEVSPNTWGDFFVTGGEIIMTEADSSYRGRIIHSPGGELFSCKKLPGETFACKNPPRGRISPGKIPPAGEDLGGEPIMEHRLYIVTTAPEVAYVAIAALYKWTLPFYLLSHTTIRAMIIRDSDLCKTCLAMHCSVTRTREKTSIYTQDFIYGSAALDNAWCCRAPSPNPQTHTKKHNSTSTWL